MVWNDRGGKGKYKWKTVYESRITKALSIFETNHDEVIYFDLLELWPELLHLVNRRSLYSLVCPLAFLEPSLNFSKFLFTFL